MRPFLMGECNMGTGDIKSVWDRMTQLQRQFLTKLTFKHLVIKCHWKSFYSQFGRNGVSAVTSSADVLTKRMVGDRNLVYKSNTKQGFVSTFDLFILHVNMRQLHYLKLGKSHTDEGFWHSNSISSKETKKKKRRRFFKANHFAINTHGVLSRSQSIHDGYLTNREKTTGTTTGQECKMFCLQPNAYSL